MQNIDDLKSVFKERFNLLFKKPILYYWLVPLFILGIIYLLFLFSFGDLIKITLNYTLDYLKDMDSREYRLKEFFTGTLNLFLDFVAFILYILIMIVDIFVYLFYILFTLFISILKSIFGWFYFTLEGVFYFIKSFLSIIVNLLRNFIYNFGLWIVKHLG